MYTNHKPHLGTSYISVARMPQKWYLTQMDFLVLALSSNTSFLLEHQNTRGTFKSKNLSSCWGIT